MNINPTGSNVSNPVRLAIPEPLWRQRLFAAALSIPLACAVRLIVHRPAERTPQVAPL
ncbi:MAG: hypothetical protein MPJ25_16095 [Pirellulales bacterium]|nr:hypothetical protein [Pirellulales bacterium]